ncbi:MAG TPA: ABC transporter permease [Tepidisphaeraceae bacterium]|nr:ABC transporter permease [Tepidisphaeraceae bacterium]
MPQTLDPDPASAIQPALDAIPSQRGWKQISRKVLDKLGPLFGLVFVVALFAALSPNTFLTTDNFQNMLRQTAVVGTAALGATVIILSGGIDLSVGSNIALCTVVIAETLLFGASPIVAALCGILSSMACGLIVGLLVTWLDLAPFIVTLGMWGAVRGAAKWFASETTVDAGNTWLNNIMQTIRSGNSWMIFPIGVWLMFALTLFVGGVLKYTRFGRHVVAIGSNEQTARLCGVRVRWTKILIYLFATLFAGIAGLLQFSYLNVGDPTTANGYELNIIAAVVIGGTSLNGGQGGVAGTLIGALIMTAVSNGCTKVGMPNSIQEIVTGGIIILAVVLDRLRHRQAV